MCLAIPAKLLTLDEINQTAVADIGGVHKEISLALVPDAKIDDYVLVHVGFALNRISEQEAHKTLALFREAELIELDE